MKSFEIAKLYCTLFLFRISVFDLNWLIFSEILYKITIDSLADPNHKGRCEDD